jgi:hypothetical protein
MKKGLLILLAIALFNCSTNDDDSSTPEETIEATIQGRWVLMGFEDTIRYEFTQDTRFTIYGTDGTFPTLEEFNQENPDLDGHDWYYEGDKVTVDLNFGNLSTLTPQFVCGNHVLKWLNDEGETHSTYFREGYDVSSCADAE